MMATVSGVVVARGKPELWRGKRGQVTAGWGRMRAINMGGGTDA